MFRVDEIVVRALEEDLGMRDITTWAAVDPKAAGKAVIIAKEELVVAGMPVAEKVFKTLDPELQFSISNSDGAAVKRDTVLVEISGRLVSMLSAERVALNFLQRLSGIASLTRSFVELVKEYPVKIMDTRKTTPGLRALEKYAVQIGGGFAHRWGLFDGIIIKDNHIKVCGSIGTAVERVKNNAHPNMKIEVEVKDLEEVKEALAAKVDIIMLDNMSNEDIAKAVKIVKKRAIVEASGGIDIVNVADVAKTGVDIVSIGALTHSARAVDIAMNVDVVDQE